jgi:hypothetical protein
MKSSMSASSYSLCCQVGFSALSEAMLSRISGGSGPEGKV